MQVLARYHAIMREFAKMNTYLRLANALTLHFMQMTYLFFILLMHSCSCACCLLLALGSSDLQLIRQLQLLAQILLGVASSIRAQTLGPGVQYVYMHLTVSKQAN